MPTCRNVRDFYLLKPPPFLCPYLCGATVKCYFTGILTGLIHLAVVLSLISEIVLYCSYYSVYRPTIFLGLLHLFHVITSDCDVPFCIHRVPSGTGLDGNPTLCVFIRIISIYTRVATATFCGTISTLLPSPVQLFGSPQSH